MEPLLRAGVRNWAFVIEDLLFVNEAVPSGGCAGHPTPLSVVPAFVSLASYSGAALRWEYQIQSRFCLPPGTSGLCTDFGDWTAKEVRALVCHLCTSACPSANEKPQALPR